MSHDSYNIYPVGVDALTLEIGGIISAEINDRAVELARQIKENPFSGLIEIVPAYASVAFFFDVSMVRKSYPDFSTAFEAVKNIVEEVFQNLAHATRRTPRLIEIPVKFRDRNAPDLDLVAARGGLDKQSVIEIFTSRIYRVFMLGFLPGFAYMGEVDERIAAPRRETPRLNVPKGSVGIAGRQTGIYPFDSPGGWQIIGATDFELFSFEKPEPCALQAGDSVKFYAVDE